ncbi:MAG: DUF2256 and DUF3253 domain-containing protein [Planctomycetota bacterium]
MSRGASVPEKFCVVCGRRIEWRKKWERDWETVKYCAKSCRSRGHKPIDDQLEAAILELLRARAGDASICPSEAAKAVSPEGWRDLMEDARMAARRLVLRGEVEITQRGHAVDASTAKGPIRVRRARTLRA